MVGRCHALAQNASKQERDVYVPRGARKLALTGTQAHFPQFVDDGALAVRWAGEHAREFGGDPRAIFLMGHSAGGHLAATLALDEQYLEKVGGSSSWIRGWIALSAPYEWKWTLPDIHMIFGGAPHRRVATDRTRLEPCSARTADTWLGGSQAPSQGSGAFG